MGVQHLAEARDTVGVRRPRAGAGVAAQAELRREVGVLAAAVGVGILQTARLVEVPWHDIKEAVAAHVLVIKEVVHEAVPVPK